MTTTNFLALWRSFTGAQTKSDRVQAQRAIEDVLGADREAALDQLVACIADESERAMTLLMSADLDASFDRLREAEDFLREFFSLTEPLTPRGQRIPKGVLMTPAAKARGPLLALARAARELLPSVRSILECQRLLDDVRAQQKDVVGSGAR